MATIHEEFDHFRKMSDVLTEDLNASYKLLKKSDSQAGRRQLCRTFFAQVEGIMWLYKQIALLSAESELTEFSNAERALLSDEQYELDSKGEVVTRSARLPFAANFLFSMRALAKSFGRTPVLPTHDAGWEKFLKSAKLRDRLMHPKTLANLTVTDAELLNLMKAHKWFLDCRGVVLNDTESALHSE